MEAAEGTGSPSEGGTSGYRAQRRPNRGRHSPGGFAAGAVNRNQGLQHDWDAFSFNALWFACLPRNFWSNVHVAGSV